MIVSGFKSASIILVILMMPMLCATGASAKQLTLRKKVTCNTNGLDKRFSCQVISTEQARSYLFKKLGTSLVHEKIAIQGKLTSEQIATIATGLVSYETIDEKWDGEVFVLNTILAVESGQLLQSVIDVRNDRQKSKKLYEINRMARKVFGEIEKIRTESLLLNKSISRPKEQEYTSTIARLNAIHLYLKGNMSEGYDAVYAYSNAIKEDPYFMYAFFERGIRYLELGHKDQAESDFMRAIQLRPTYADAYYRLGIIRMDRGDFGKALEDFDRVLSHDTANADAYYRRGAIHTRHGDYGKAIKDFDRALNLNPSNADAYCYRGITNVALGYSQRALNDFNTAIKLNPTHTEAYYHRGVVYRGLDNLHEAIIDFDKAIHLDPAYTEAYVARGNAYEHIGNFELAFKDFDKAKELNLNNTVD